MNLNRFKNYLANQSPALAETTQRHYFDAARAYLREYESIDDDLVNDHLTQLLKTTSAANRNRHRKALIHLYKCHGRRFPDYVRDIKEVPQPRIAITDDEIDAIISVDPPPSMYGVFFKTLSYTGARPSEILNLRLEDIDEAAHVMYIRESKTGSREIPILEALQEDLYKYCSTLTQSLLFPSPKSDTMHITHEAYMKEWRKRLGILGIKKKVKPYALRRSFITKTLANGGSLFSIQDMVGHKNAETTKRYYHGNIDLMREAANTLPRAIQAINPWEVVQQLLLLIRKYLGKREDINLEISESNDEVVIRIKKK